MRKAFLCFAGDQRATNHLVQNKKVFNLSAGETNG